MSTFDGLLLPTQGSRAARCHAWLQLLRPPNLFTVPGDPLAGYLLAWAALGGGVMDLWRAALVAVASLLLYAGGLLQNDVFDLAEDRLQRPDRPLPSALVSPGTVIVAAVVLALLGVAAAAAASAVSGLVAAVLLVAVTGYNAGGKRVRLAGPMLMGACRGLSLLVGAGALGWLGLQVPAALLSAGGLLLLIAAITWIASRETEIVHIGLRRWVPALIVTIWLGLLWIMAAPSGGLPSWIAMALAGWAAFWMVYCAGPLKGRPEPRVVQRTIGRFIGGLLFVQAALAAQARWSGLIPACGLLLCWPLTRRLARWFYAS